MVLDWIDHAFVILVLLLILPIAGRLGFQRFLARAQTNREAAQSREFKENLLWLLGLGAVTLIVWLLHERRLHALFFRDPEWRGPWIAAGLLAVAIAVVVVRPLAFVLSKKMADAFARSIGDFVLFLPTTPRTLTLGLAVSVAAGLFEEIAYRGYLLPYFEALLPLWGAVLASSLLFGLGHAYQGAGGMVGTTFLGLFLALTYLATGHLWAPIVLHALIDISSMLMSYRVLRRPDTA